MNTTMTSYQAVTRNLTRSLTLTAEKPDVAASTAYFKANIGKVKNLDDFMANDRLYRYAVDAFGLGDMAYAKALIRKVLAEGVESSSSAANRLSDKRYREFAAAFDFLAEKTETGYFQTNIVKVTTVTGFTAASASQMFDYAIEAFQLESIVDTPKEKQAVVDALHLGKDSPLRFEDPALDKRFRDFVQTFNFYEKGAKATQDKAMMQKTVDLHNTVVRTEQATVTVEKFTRQRLELDEGARNDNVRLALYFERKAPAIKNAYEVIADPALLKVLQTALGLPPSTSAMDIDRQAALYEKRIDFDDFKDPVKVKAFLTRFTALADLSSGTTAANSALTILVGPPVAAGVSTDVLFSIQNLRLGGL